MEGSCTNWQQPHSRVNKKASGTNIPFSGDFSSSDSSETRNGRRKSFADRPAQGAIKIMADFLNEIGHLFLGVQNPFIRSSCIFASIGTVLST